MYLLDISISGPYFVNPDVCMLGNEMSVIYIYKCPIFFCENISNSGAEN